MNLGILVNSDLHLEDIIGFTHAASSNGHTVTIFVMDTGTLLLEKKELTGLCSIKDVEISFCMHSAEITGIKTEGLPENIVKGSQFHNALMNQKADKVIVL